jgi:adenine-specific DNA-methyltransferase
MLPTQISAFYGYRRTLRAVVRGNNVRAEALAIEVLCELVRRKYPLLMKRLPKKSGRSFSDSHQIKINRFVDWLEPQDVIDAAFWLSSLYANLVSERMRHGRALFFTPPELAQRVIHALREQGADFATARVIDPACGGAAFLAPIATAIADKLRAQGVGPRKMLKHLETHLTGWDIDPTLCKLSALFVLTAVYREIALSRYVPDIQVACADSLKRGLRHRGRYDVVVCNPPYRKVSQAERRSLELRDCAIAHGQPNYYAIFMTRALGLAKRHGRIGLITPASFLSGRSFGPLRKQTAKSNHLKQIDLIDRRQGVFVGVEQEAVLSIFCRKRPTEDAETAVFTLGSKGAKLVGMVSIPSGERPWVLPRMESDVQILALHRNIRHTIRSYGYECKTGLFVPHRDRRRTSRARAWRESVPLLWSTDIGQDGSLKFDRVAHRARYIRIASADERLIHRVPGVALQRTTAADDTRRLVAAPIGHAFLRRYGGYVGENHVLFLLKQEDAICDEVTLAAILRSETVDRLFRCLSGSVAVSLTDLQELPLPDPKEVERLIQKGIDVNEAVKRAFDSPLAKGRDSVRRDLRHSVVYA